MSTVVVLGASGGIGGVAARTVAASGAFDRVVLADARLDAAEALADLLARQHDTGIEAIAFDADEPSSVAGVLRDATVAVSCVGPFFRYGPPLLQAAIEAGVDYVDVCDDLRPTVAMLALDPLARSNNVRALIGMGNSPGLANVLVRFCADQLLDQVDTVDIMHIHGGEPDEGAAVLHHRIHAMTNDVPVWEDGAQRIVRMLEPSGAEYVAEVDFRDVGAYPVYPYPHPETITLPMHLPGVQRVTNRGVVFPLSYFELTMDMVKAGICGTDPLTVNGQPVVPLDFAVAHVLSQRPRLLAQAGITGPAGCLRIDVTGRKDAAEHAYVFSLSSTTAGAGEGTGIPAGLGAIMMARGEIDRAGVHPPEAVVDPLRMLALAGDVVKALGVDAGPGGLPIHIEHRGPDGAVDEFALTV